MSIPYEEQQCQFCMYFKFFSGANGVCRRTPPLGNRTGESNTWQWPMMGVDEWCGEFKEIPPPAKTHV